MTNDFEHIGPQYRRAKPVKTKAPLNGWPRIYLRCIDPGTNNECWVVCAKGDPGAIPFLRENQSAF